MPQQKFPLAMVFYIEHPREIVRSLAELPKGDFKGCAQTKSQFVIFLVQVVEAERRLRAALLLDGLKPKPGYELARYNDPFTLPFLRRNEVLIELEDFQL